MTITSADLIPIDTNLRLRLIAHLAVNGNPSINDEPGSPNPSSVENLLHRVADLDDAVGSGPGEDGIITLSSSSGMFHGAYATPAAIARLRAAEEAHAVYLRCCFETGDRVEAGTGDDHDTGTVRSVAGDEAEIGWDSGVITPAKLADLGLL